jgi:enoyl-CoA hydratase
VHASEALEIGLVNRVVPAGEALASAVRLAEQIARFPQVCMRADRASAYAAFDGDLSEALAAEFRVGVSAFAAEGLDGAARFRNGAGRHGADVPDGSTPGPSDG